MKNILMAVQPKWLAKILNGEKSVEIRKTIPDCLKNGEPITVWLYCTKGKPELHRYDSWNGEEWERHFLLRKPIIGEWLQNGLVVAKCVVEKWKRTTKSDWMNEDSCFIMRSEMHLTALTVFDKPMELRQFDTVKSKLVKGSNDGLDRLYIPKKIYTRTPLTRAPQSWMYVEVGE